MRYGIWNIQYSNWCNPFYRPFHEFTRDINEVYKAHQVFTECAYFNSGYEIKIYDKDADMTDEEIAARFEKQHKIECEKYRLEYVPTK